MGKLLNRSIVSLTMTILAVAFFSGDHSVLAWCCSCQASPSHVAKDYDYFASFLLPPGETTREQVDAVYGSPVIDHYEAIWHSKLPPIRELPSDTYFARYPLLGATTPGNATVTLVVKYVKGRVVSSAFMHLRLTVNGLPLKSIAEAAKREQEECNIRCEDLSLLYDAYAQCIIASGWEKQSN